MLIVIGIVEVPQAYFRIKECHYIMLTSTFIFFILYRSLTSPYRCIYVTHASRAYKATTCRERELTLDHIHTFLATQGHGGSPRMSDQLNVGATSETTRT